MKICTPYASRQLQTCCVITVWRQCACQITHKMRSRGELHLLPSEGKRDLWAAAFRNTMDHFTLYAKAALPQAGSRSVQWRGICLCLSTRHYAAGCVSVDHIVDQRYDQCQEQWIYPKNSFSVPMHCTVKNCFHMTLWGVSMLTYFSVCACWRSCACSDAQLHHWLDCGSTGKELFI